MNQTNLNRAVARATGETVDRIQRMGFSLVIMPPVFARPLGNYAIPRLSPRPASTRSVQPRRPLAASA